MYFEFSQKKVLVRLIGQFQKYKKNQLKLLKKIFNVQDNIIFILFFFFLNQFKIYIFTINLYCQKMLFISVKYFKVSIRKIFKWPCFFLTTLHILKNLQDCKTFPIVHITGCQGFNLVLLKILFKILSEIDICNKVQLRHY